MLSTNLHCKRNFGLLLTTLHS